MKLGLQDALLLILLILSTVQCTAGLEVTLFDSTKVDALDWSTSTLTGGSRVGWREGSYTGAQGSVTRVYTVCNVDSISVNNWLRTTFIPRGAANRLYINLKFTVRKCTNYPDPSSLQHCKESFRLLYREDSADYRTSLSVTEPAWNESAYQNIDVIAANNVFVDNKDAVVNDETRSIAVRNNGVYFVFQDQGACMTLLSVRIYYIVCPQQISSFSMVPRTAAGENLTSVVQVEAGCVVGATAKDRVPLYLCQADGNWFPVSGACQCSAGFESDNQTSTACTACRPQTYKSTAGSGGCSPCPNNTEALTPAAVTCSCKNGYFRSDTGSPGAVLACNESPGPARNLRMTYWDESTANLIWDSPIERGSPRGIFYRISCDVCGPDVRYTPTQSGYNVTRVTLWNLRPNSYYTVTVSTQTDETGLSASTTQVSFETKTTVPYRVTTLEVGGVSSDYINVRWTAPSSVTSLIDLYEVKYHINMGDVDESAVLNYTILTTRSNNLTITSLQSSTSYVIMVRIKTKDGFGPYSEKVIASTKATGSLNGGASSSSDNLTGVIAGCTAGLAVCLIIIAIVVIVFVRKRKNASSESSGSDCDMLKYINGQCGPPLDARRSNNSTSSLHSSMVTDNNQHIYSDPYIYEDPNQLIRASSPIEINPSLIVIEDIFHKGHFGDNCIGNRLSSDGRASRVVIKTLSEQASDKDRVQFLTCANNLSQLRHPSIVRLDGIVSQTLPHMILLEFLPNRSLVEFLKKHRYGFSLNLLVRKMWNLASAMSYLFQSGFVHKDIAGRNVLVDRNFTCKLSSFELCREIADTSRDEEQPDKVSIRWAAPEVLARRRYSIASDVWSFGVLMWEMVTYGELPYVQLKDSDVVNVVLTGSTLPLPRDCPTDIHAVMLNCWRPEPSARPTFRFLEDHLYQLMSGEDVRNDLSPNSTTPILNLQGALPPQPQDLATWLHRINLPQYIDAFRANGYTSVEDVVPLSQTDLFALGVATAEHCRIILESLHRNINAYFV